MTRQIPKTLLLLLGLTTVVGAACSSGASSTSAVATTKVPVTAAGSATTVGGGTTGTTAAGTCQSTTAATGGSGGGDVLVPGDIPDGIHYVTYHGSAFHIDHPEGWAQQAAGTTATFTDKFNSIKVETSAAPAPTVATAQSTDVAALKTSASCFEPGKVTQVSRTSGSAILITYRADSPPDPVTGKVVRQDVERYEFWQSGTRATVTLSAPKGSDNVDPWKKVTDSFGWGA